MKNVDFCRKTSQFLPKRCLFIFCIFYLKEKELKQQVCLIKSEIYLSQKKKDRGAKT